MTLSVANSTPCANPSHIVLFLADESLAQELTSALSSPCFELASCTSLPELFDLIDQKSADIVIIDLAIQIALAHQLCTRVLEHAASVEIVMISHEAHSHDIVNGFASGAADVITGPHLDTPVLTARLKQLIRRRPRYKTVNLPRADDSEQIIRFGPITIYPARYAAYLHNRSLTLTIREFHILAHLAAHPGRVASRHTLASICTHHDQDLSDRAIDNVMSRLRRKLGEEGKLLHSIRGAGYCLDNY